MEGEGDGHGTAFTVSCDLKEGVTTGISAGDRAKTVGALASPNTMDSDLVRPGHIFPLIAREGGVLKREGHTEAAIDLMILAGLEPCGVICEIMNDDGTMARGKDLRDFCKKHNLFLLSIEEIIEYRKSFSVVPPVSIPTKRGDLYLESFENSSDSGNPHLFLYFDKNFKDVVDIRIHSECLTGDLLGSKRCDCGEQLEYYLDYIKENGGAILYLRQEGRGIGLVEKLKAYSLQDKGIDTLEANHLLGFKGDERSYSFAGEFLLSRGIGRVRLLTNNRLKIDGLKAAGVEVLDRIQAEVKPCKSNIFYLETKKNKMGHILREV